MFGSDDEAPINAKPKAEKIIPPSPQPIPENMERVYEPEEKFYFLRPKPQTESISKIVSKPKSESKPKDNIKIIIETKPTTKANPPTKPKNNIYSRIKYECKEGHAELKNKIALATHSYSHNRKYLENTGHFDINSSQNMKEF